MSAEPMLMSAEFMIIRTRPVRWWRRLVPALRFVFSGRFVLPLLEVHTDTGHAALRLLRAEVPRG